jgi:hypothetical protein
VKARNKPGKSIQVNLVKATCPTARTTKLTACRARVKQTIAELEKQVEFLTQELRLARLETASLQQKNQLSPPGTIPVTSPPLSMTSLGHYPEGIAAVMDVQVQQKSCPPQYGGMGSQFSNPFIISGPVSTGNLGPPS